MDFPEVRKFLLASFHDLPNVLFVGALVLGSLMGYLPLVWLALGMIFNGFVTAGAQSLVRLLLKFKTIGDWDQKTEQLSAPNMQKCGVGFQILADTNTFTKTVLGSADRPILAPSYWMSSAAFFAFFSIYNSIRVAAKESKGKVDANLVSTRRAYSTSTVIVGLAFLALLSARVFTGCESSIGALVSLVLALGVAIGYWHILDSCGTGKMPDILQVVGSMAPKRTDTETPVMCTPPSE